MTRTLHIISHSHWDREWHQTFQRFRLRLVKLIDDVLDVLVAGDSFPYFMLDGQTVVLEDYLEIRPERADELKGQIQAGRLLIGPWYVHPDEFLVSGEAIIRNLLVGAQISRDWGGYMAVGYVPDQFGHIAQMPQIFQGFGIDNAVLWRGVERSAAGTAFTWRSPDGSTVLAASLADSYGQASWLPTSGQATADRLRTLAQSLEPIAATDTPLLIMNGGDHVGVQADLPAGLSVARDLLAGEYRVLHSTLPAYLVELARAGEPSVIIEGELRSSRDAYLLPGVASTRAWIKQRNARIQTLLERFAEPLATIASALGSAYPRGPLLQSWKYLLQNQPHDSICGCSIDQVHREMITRFDWSEQIAEAVGDSALAIMASQIDSVVPGAEDPHTLAVTVFNGAPVPQAGRIDVQLRLANEASSYEVVDEAGRPVPHTWIGERGESPTVVELPREEVPDLATMMSQFEGNRVLGEGIADVSMRTLGDALHVEVTTSDQAILSRQQLEQAARDAFALADSAGSIRAVATIHRSVELHLVALAPDVPACGYRTLLLRPRSGASREQPDAPASPELLPSIQNEYYRIEPDSGSGALTMIERTSGVAISPAHMFVDGGDAGDLYTYCAPSSDLLVGGGSVQPEMTRHSGALGEALQIRQVLKVPQSLADTRWERHHELVDLGIVTTVSLAPGDRLVRFETTVENSVQDHRLRMHMTLPFSADHAHAEDAFGMVRRVAQPDTSGKWAETPVGTAPHQGVVAVHDESNAFVLATRGLPEYEVLEGHNGRSELALTLLRCTGWLSRSDLYTRPGEAGPSLRTPEAQCQGTQRFEYAIAFGAQLWRDLLPVARSFAVPLRTHVGPCAEGNLLTSDSLVAIRPASVVLSAFKGAADGRGAVLRVYNDDRVAHTAQLSWCVPVRRATVVNLAEHDGAVLFDGEARDGCEIEVPAAGIVSVRLEWV